MRELRHNVTNILYMIRSMTELHLLQAEAGRFRDSEERLRKAEEAIRKTHLQSVRGLEITRRITESLRAAEPVCWIPPHKACVRKEWQDVRESLAREFPGKGEEWITKIPEDFPKIACLPARFREILYYLAKNSVQAMPSGGKIILRAEVGFTPHEDPAAVITLADTGSGIPEEVITRVFDLFFTTKPPDEGSGLGLYLVRKLVMNHHGKIRVSSFPGCGAAFTLQFPLYRKKKKRRR